MTVLDRQATLISELRDFPTSDDLLEYVIDLGKALPGLSEELKDEHHLVPGCVSRVWLHAWLENGRVKLLADSDAMIVRGIVALLLQVFADAPPHEILAADPSFLDKAGFANLLSVNRRNGLSSMIARIFQAASTLSDGHS